MVQSEEEREGERERRDVRNIRTGGQDDGRREASGSNQEW